MNLKEFVRFTYGLFMGTSTPFLKPAKRYLFPVFRKEVSADFGLFLGGSGICGVLNSPTEKLVINTNQGAAAANFRAWVDARAAGGSTTVVFNSLENDFAGGIGAFADAAKIFVGPATERKISSALGSLADRTETVREARVIEIAGERVHLIPTAPIASSSSLVVFLEKHSVLFLGPLFFNRIHPILRGDAEISTARWISTVEELLNRFHPQVIVPAEGDTASEADVRVFLSYLRDIANPAVEFSFCRQTYDWPEIPSYTSLEENFDLIRTRTKTHASLNN